MNMGKTVEFYFDVGSPASYLAWKRLPAIAAATDATVTWRPMLLGGVFKATGNASPVTVPAKGKWLMEDLGRFAARTGVPLRMPASFPINTLPLMRGTVGMLMRRPADFERYVSAVFDGLFGEGADMGDPAVVARVLTNAGINPAAFEALIADPEVKSALIASTEEAVARGVFGAPTFFVDGVLHFGQDRLDFVEAALRS
jgi:2-hydroxychromene-2-carboxylate isomerase